ncbi:hypothetical protein B0H14DRAFT_2739729 [Mycena olivaceomarginata]|nr:hypothetical protein B0H14DRAFT_2739729 [Mycena olivaceomarginata]
MGSSLRPSDLRLLMLELRKQLVQMGSQLELYWMVLADFQQLHTGMDEKAVEAAELLQEIDSIIQEVGLLRGIVGSHLRERYATRGPTTTDRSGAPAILRPGSTAATQILPTFHRGAREELRRIAADVEQRKSILSERTLIRLLHNMTAGSEAVVKPRLRLSRCRPREQGGILSPYGKKMRCATDIAFHSSANCP